MDTDTSLTQQFRLAEHLDLCVLAESAWWFAEVGEASMLVPVWKGETEAQENGSVPFCSAKGSRNRERESQDLEPQGTPDASYQPLGAAAKVCVADGEEGGAGRMTWDRSPERERAG